MSVNKIILLGNVGQDPKIHRGDNFMAASFPLATTRKGFTAANGTVVPDKTTWHNITAKNGLATVVERFVKKGTQLYVEGEQTYREYESNGEKKTFPEVLANDIQLLGRKES